MTGTKAAGAAPYRRGKEDSVRRLHFQSLVRQGFITGPVDQVDNAEGGSRL